MNYDKSGLILHTLLFLVFKLTFSFCAAQKLEVIMNGAKFKLSLPDSLFQPNRDSTEFYRSEYAAKFTFAGSMDDEDGNINFETFSSMLTLEFTRPGVIIILDSMIKESKSRLIKTKIYFDTTDAKPAEKGAVNISWIYIYNDHNKPVLLLAEYRAMYDAVLNDTYIQSLLSMKKLAEMAGKDENH